MARGLRAVPRRAAAAGTARHGVGRRGLRRLRASSDRDRRDAGRRALGVSRSPHLGDLRAALRDVVPADLSGGVRARLREGRPRHAAGRVPIDAARGPAAVGGAAGRGPAGARQGRPLHPRRRRHRRDGRAARPATATSSSSCRTADSTTSTRSSSRRSRRERPADDSMLPFRMTPDGDSAILVECRRSSIRGQRVVRVAGRCHCAQGRSRQCAMSCPHTARYRLLRSAADQSRVAGTGDPACASALTACRAHEDRHHRCAGLLRRRGTVPIWRRSRRFAGCTSDEASRGTRR